MEENKPIKIPVSETIYLFTCNGMGNAAADLMQTLAVKFLSLVFDSGDLPAKILFYTEGVKLCCHGSPAVEILRQLESAGVELILCKTCIDYFQLTDQVEVGVVGGMPDIIESLHMAGKVISM